MSRELLATPPALWNRVQILAELQQAVPTAVPLGVSEIDLNSVDLADRPPGYEGGGEWLTLFLDDSDTVTTQADWDAVCAAHTVTSSLGRFWQTQERGNFSWTSWGGIFNGEEMSTLIYLPLGATVSTVTFIMYNDVTGPMHGFVTLRNVNGVRLAYSTDFGDTARTAGDIQNVSFITPYTTQGEGWYYVGASWTADSLVQIGGTYVADNTLWGSLGLSLPHVTVVHGAFNAGTPTIGWGNPYTTASVDRPWFLLT